MKRAGFTMIELIFVIVILGILAAVAVPKLAATREDAKVASEMTSVAQALQNLGAEWVAQGAWGTDSLTTAQKAVNCFTLATTADGNVTIASGATTGHECAAKVKEGTDARAIASGLIDNATSAKHHQFGGQGVKW